MAKLFTVLTADVVASRRLWNRKDAQADLKEAVGRLNLEAGGALITRFSIMSGDQIQGVLRNASGLPKVLRRLRGLVYPVRLRVGIGIGEIVTEIRADYSGEMDGPAFHNARWCLEAMKREKFRLTMCKSPEAELDETVNAVFALMDAVQNRWTREQWAAIQSYDRYGTYRAAAEELGIALQNVEKRCSAADWPAFHEAEEYLAGLLRRFSPTEG
ncbi:MAG: SatD family protein [Syntrophothermus sp.]